MELPLVSVVIPAYNRPDTLKIAINSVLKQSYSNIELIICDDSSNNEVEEMIESYVEKYSHIKYYKNERNLFLENWHKCFDVASGEYINYLMDDDVFHEDKIRQMMYFFQEFDQISLVTSFRQLIDMEGSFLPPIHATRRLFTETRIMNGINFGNIALSNCLNIIGEPTTVLFKKSDLSEKFGVFQGKQYSLINDLATWLLLLTKGKAVYISDALSYFRIHPNQNNNTMGSKAFSEWLDIMIASRKMGFLDTNELYSKALFSYRERIFNHSEFKDDVEVIDKIIASLH